MEKKGGWRESDCRLHPSSGEGKQSNKHHMHGVYILLRLVGASPVPLPGTMSFTLNNTVDHGTPGDSLHLLRCRSCLQVSVVELITAHQSRWEASAYV